MSNTIAPPQSAAEILDRMKTIVDNDMARPGVYVSDKVVNEELAKAGSICNGHQACALGSLALSAALPDVTKECGEHPFFNTGADRPREEILSGHPILEEAYEALEDAAQERISSLSADEQQTAEAMAKSFGSHIEGLFESSVWSEKIPLDDPEWLDSETGKRLSERGKAEYLALIDAARDKVTSEETVSEEMVAVAA